VNATVVLFYNKQSTVEAYCEVDLYIHVFSKKTLGADVLLTSTFDRYLSRNKKHQYVLNTGHTVRVWMEEFDRGKFLSYLGLNKHI